jgi:ABC-type transport system involved in multi-copper enzyme maturation permease subunit
MRNIGILVKRDLKNSLNRRFFFLLGFLLLFQLWFIATSGSVKEVLKTGTMHYMAVVFSFNFFGSIMALALNYDGVSAERESKFLDLVLTSGVSKRAVYLSKVLTSLLISAAFAVLYSLPVALFYGIRTGSFLLGLQALRYVGPIIVFLLIFSQIGLALSVALRSTRASLIVSILLGVLMMPRLMVAILDGINTFLKLPQNVLERVYLISPALILNALNGYADSTTVWIGLLLFALYVAGSIVIGVSTFHRQDELNYGE